MFKAKDKVIHKHTGNRYVVVRHPSKFNFEATDVRPMFDDRTHIILTANLTLEKGESNEKFKA